MFVFLKRMWNLFFPVEPYCEVCGRRKEDYYVDDALRQHVTKGALTMLCFRHFEQMARSRGLTAYFRVSAETEWPQDPFREA